VAGQMENKSSVGGDLVYCLVAAREVSGRKIYCQGVKDDIMRVIRGEVHPPGTISIMQRGQPIDGLGNNVISLPFLFDFSRILRSKTWGSAQAKVVAKTYFHVTGAVRARS
jgi:hypothetical protein